MLRDRMIVPLWIAAVLLTFWAAPLRAACGLAIGFAVDVSNSVTDSDYRTQLEGLAAGLRDPLVARTLADTGAAVTLMQWAGASRQEVTLPWQTIDSLSDVEAVARAIETAPRFHSGEPTAVGHALSFAVGTFDAGPRCARRVLDISGDGVSNEGISPLLIRPALQRAGITVNALVIETGADPVTDYYRDNVIVGQSAFAVTANGFADYPARMREKLWREVVFQMAELRLSPGDLLPEQG